MRIAIINRVFSRAAGGAESYAVAVAQELAGRHEVHIFSQETNRPVEGITYHRVFCLSQKPRWINQLLFAVASWWATRKGFDVVHSHENTWHGQVQTIHVRPLRYNLLHGRRGTARALRWLKVALSPRLITYIWLEGSRFKPAPGRSVVATSTGLKQECERAYPGARAMLTVITPGTSLQQDTIPRNVARRQLDLPFEVSLLLFVANDYKRKGLDVLLKALGKLPKDVHLAVVGNPAHIAHYRQLAESMAIATRVHFMGSQDALDLVYRAADCLAHPTLEDTYAMVVLEAMAHGLPVVVSGPAHCGISRELQDGFEALLLHDPRDATALAAMLRTVLEDSAMAAQLRQQGLRFAKTHSWESTALQYEALYQKAKTSP
ncbi:MAG: glycosyltransferase family 4 protein [Gammaproteobacteria bacterium]|nr:glycosyltransferase family 4 protein [Gammaproteobacteria bacterium]